MNYEKPKFNLSGDEKQELIDQSQYIYGDASREHASLKYSQSLSRYAALGRKVLSHYGGEHYNPHTVKLEREWWVRKHIQEWVQYKVFYKIQGHDWDYLDNFFKKVVGELLEIEIPYNKERLEQGLLPEYRPQYEFVNNKVN